MKKQYYKKEKIIEQQSENITKLFFQFLLFMILIGISVYFVIEYFFAGNDKLFNYFTAIASSSIGFFGVILTLVSNINYRQNNSYNDRKLIRNIRKKIYRKRKLF